MFGIFDNDKILLSLNVGRYEGFFSAGGDFVDEGASTARDAFGRIALHEFAHAVHAKTSAANQARITVAWNRARRQGSWISKYAKENENEWFAETVEAYLVDLDAEAAALIRDIPQAEALE